MTNREKLALAAKACGQSITWSDIYGKFFRNSAELGQPAFWQPDTDQADSDCMACDLELSLKFFDDCVCCIAYYTRDENSLQFVVTHDGTSEDRRRAVREARMDVAVEIGRLK